MNLSVISGVMCMSTTFKNNLHETIFYLLEIIIFLVWFLSLVILFIRVTMRDQNKLLSMPIN